MRKLFVIMGIGGIMAFSSCTKDPGPGGKTNITGNIYKTTYCSENGSEIERIGAVGERVYITYGSGKQFDDDVRAGSDGYFQFRFMNPGKYKVTVLSDCPACPGGSEEMSQSFEVGNKDRDVKISNIEIKDYNNDYCEGPGEGGSSSIMGNVEALYIDENNFDTIGTGPLSAERVYIIYGQGTTQSDDIRTSADGSYKFSELRPGKYRLYAYSSCIFCPSGEEAIYVDAEITSEASTVNAPKISVVIYQ